MLLFLAVERIATSSVFADDGVLFLSVRLLCPPGAGAYDAERDSQSGRHVLRVTCDHEGHGDRETEG